MGEEIHYYLQCYLVNLKINMPNSLRDGRRQSFKHDTAEGLRASGQCCFSSCLSGTWLNVLNTIFISNRSEWKRPKRNRGGTGSVSGLLLDVGTLATRTPRDAAEQVRCMCQHAERLLLPLSQLRSPRAGVVSSLHSHLQSQHSA